jgi:uncharacterized protein (TIGR03083 family)
MGTTLIPEERHLAGIRAATDALATAAGLGWLGAKVPTCPDWRLLDLIAHQGMVHRWATAAVQGDRELMGNAAQLEDEGRTHRDPVVWLTDGATNLLAALENAPADLEALVFLHDAPAPRQFWARRQCHETTIHALDAIAAQSGRTPTAQDAWFGADLAADGIDELLTGFWQRRRGGPRAREPYAVSVRPDDSPQAWVVRVGPERTEVTRTSAAEGTPDEPDADHELTGSATDLYLALWNRGGTVTDAGGILPRWRTEAAITWG